MFIPVLMYHKIVDTNNIRDKYEVTKNKFILQMQFLKEQGYHTVHVEDLENNLSEYIKQIMITFDDASETDFKVALPILQQYGFKSSHFIPVGCIGTKRFMNWDQIRKLKESGASIQSHAMTHRRLEGLPDEEIKQELLLSKNKIKKEIGYIPVALALPMGSKPQQIKQLLKECGYRYLFTSRPCVNNFTRNEAVLEFGRLRITDNMGSKYFRKILTPRSLFYRTEQLVFAVKKPIKKIFRKKRNHCHKSIFFNER